MSYRRVTLPASEGNRGLVEALERELLEIERALQKFPFLLIETISVEPEKPRDGMIVLADGTEWDPGSGHGYYGYRDGAWRALE